MAFASISITPLYAGILGIMAIAIAFAAGRMRVEKNVSVGDGGDVDLLLAMRRHANFVEFVPLCLLMIALIELRGAPDIAVHLLGAGLVIFRVCHAVGIKAETTGGVLRGAGAGGSTLVLLVSSIWAITTFF